MQVQVITVLVFALVGCLISLITWLGLDRRSLGPKLWTLSFFLYTLLILTSFFGIGHGLYSAYQVPILAILAWANWLQYKGFRSFLVTGNQASGVVQWPLVLLGGAACSALSFALKSPLVTFAIESSLGVSLVAGILVVFLRRRQTFNPLISAFVVSILSLVLLACLASLVILVVAAIETGLSGPLPENPLAFGPLKWLVSLVLLALIENVLVSGTLLEEKVGALRDSEEARKKTDDLNTELQAIQRDILGTMAIVFEKRTIETSAHVERVAELTEKLLVELNYLPTQARWVGDAARLHDIGKIGIPDEILKSTERLSPQERGQMQLHTVYGHQILSKLNSEFFQLAARIAIEHHEHWDGSGYPQGLRFTQISAEARAVSIVDTFDALTSRRSYKEPWDVEQALAWMEDQSGRQFDPDFVGPFVALVRTHGLGIRVPVEVR